MDHRHSIENKYFRLSTCGCTDYNAITVVDKEKKVISFISSKKLLELIRSTYKQT